MKKAKKADELRPEYLRADFDALVRGKYIKRLRERSNVVVLDPEIAKVFPNGASVNACTASACGHSRADQLVASALLLKTNSIRF
jgi:hypothetical protein